MLTAQQLADALGIPLARATAWADHINAAMARFAINTPKRIAAFLGQIGVESVLLTHTAENLDYTAALLLRVFHNRVTPAQAMALAHNPEAIANHLYCNRIGNGDEASGDGWRFRGRGLIQVTGRANYHACGAAIGKDLEAAPEALEAPEDAALSAAWYFASHGCNELADAGDFVHLTAKVNTALLGLDHRQAIYTQALNVLTKGTA